MKDELRKKAFTYKEANDFDLRVHFMVQHIRLMYLAGLCWCCCCCCTVAPSHLSDPAHHIHNMSKYILNKASKSVSEAIRTRKSVRQFTDKAVSTELVATIFREASRAPSGGNLQPWRVRLACFICTFLA